MRTYSFLAALAIVGATAGGAVALDPNLSPAEAFRSGYEAYKAGDAATAVEALNFAAGRGHTGALWKLGRMYATGDLVDEDDRKAMEFFAKVANDYADENPNGPDAPFVANAFVTLGNYYQHGIPGTVEADPFRARRYFSYAASYFGDPDAQYSLAVMYLAGQGGEQNARQAARWFKLAARKGHVGAQAELGQLLYEGNGVDRRPVEGLTWLSIAALSTPGDPQIRAMHEQAFSTATEEQRRDSLARAQDWLNRHVQTQAAQAPQTPATQ
jgi:TPR repeat protein